MKSYDVIVVGGSAAGVTAAITAKRQYPDKSVLLIRREEKVPIPCGIPYVMGTVMSTDKNLIPDGALTNNGVELLVDETIAIDRAAHTVTTANGQEIAYDRLVIATGSQPFHPPIPGADKANVFFAKKDVRYLDDLLERLNGMREVVVLGGGFIGVEFADELHKRDIRVTIVEMLPHCLMLAFDDDICEECEATLRERGVEIIAGVKLEEILGTKKVTGVKLSDGRELTTDAVLMAIGVVPDVQLAQQAGLETDRLGLKVNAQQRTSDERIFGVGDCTSKISFLTNRPSPLKLASIATNEARVAGANLFTTRRTNPGVIGVFSTAIGNCTIAVAGLTERAAAEEKTDVVVSQSEAPDRHPGGMPGMSQMKVKLLFDKKGGSIVGGSVRGGPSAGEVINTISACIQNRMTANDIAQFQLGTHPAVTASPIAYQLVNAAESALLSMM